MAGLIDTHLHLYLDDFDEDREETADRARACGVVGFVHVGFDPESSRRALEVARRLGGFATVGLHPHDAARWDGELEDALRGLSREPETIAIGECGLDFFRDLSPRTRQHEAFAGQIALAKERQLPMVFHVRDAYDETRAQLVEEGLPPRRGVFHAFAGDRDFARWAVDEGFTLGIGGPLTYKRSRLPEAIEGLPASSFLLETDAPWLPPQPWRGRRNEPAYLRETAERLAEICGLELDEVAEGCAQNFERIFGRELPAGWRAIRPSRAQAPEPPRKRK